MLSIPLHMRLAARDRRARRKLPDVASLDVNLRGERELPKNPMICLAGLEPSLRRQMLTDLIAFEVEHDDDRVLDEIEALIAAARATVKWQRLATSTDDGADRVTTISRTTGWNHSESFSTTIPTSRGSTSEEEPR